MGQTIDIEDHLAKHNITRCPTMKAAEWQDLDDAIPAFIPCEGAELVQLAKQIIMYGN